jgi:hypothetical protein
MKKKAQLELLFMIAVLFMIGLVAFVGYRMFTEINTDMQADNTISAEAKAASSSLYSRFPSIFDSGFIFVFVIIWISILVSSYFIDSSPAFFIISLILFAFTIVVALGLNEGYEAILQDSEFSTYNTVFPMTNYIISNLPLVAVIVGFSILIVLYAKARGSGGGYY